LKSTAGSCSCRTACTAASSPPVYTPAVTSTPTAVAAAAGLVSERWQPSIPAS
jgi:hypothetical protein